MNDKKVGSIKLLKLNYRRGDQIIQTFYKIDFPQNFFFYWDFFIFVFFLYFNWDSLYARLNIQYKSWNSKKRSTKRIT